MALKLRKSEAGTKTAPALDEEGQEEGPNDHLGEEPVDAPVGYAPRIVQAPMTQNADVNPEVHEAKQEAKAKTKAVKKGLKKIVPDGSSMPRTSEGRKGGTVVSHTGTNNKPVYLSSQNGKRVTQNGLRRNKAHKAITPGNQIGGPMSKNEVADLFKSELGDDGEPALTNCVHCNHALSKSDLRKGLGVHFVADDNDNPHDGSETGHVEPSRGVPGAKENDEIAPLLKGLKGPDAGAAEEFPIHKSEMLEMGMQADELEDGWYTITKSEMQKQAPDHLEYLVDRKTRVAKSMRPTVLRKSDDSGSARSATDGPHGYSPRAGGVYGPGGEPLVSWSQGSDAEVAKYIEKSGGYGPGTDESIRTEGRGY